MYICDHDIYFFVRVPLSHVAFYYLKSLLKYKMYELHPHWYLGQRVIQKYCPGSFDMNSSTNLFIM